MTARVRVLTVTLDHDIRDDDLKTVITAIKLMRCVSDVSYKPVTGTEVMARHTVAIELRHDIISAVEAALAGEKWKPSKERRRT